MINSLYEPFRSMWSSVGTIYLYSDTHFDEDDDLRNIYPNRPSAEEQVKSINSKVGKCDTIIFLGDVGNIEWMKKVRGHRILVAGNHDKGMSNYESAFEYIFSGPIIISEKIILSHEPIKIPGLYNIHGHNHQGQQFAQGSMNVCSDVINYIPVNFNQFIKSGHLKEIETLHRITIDKQTDNKRKRLAKGKMK